MYVEIQSIDWKSNIHSAENDSSQGTFFFCVAFDLSWLITLTVSIQEAGFIVYISFCFRTATHITKQTAGEIWRNDVMCVLSLSSMANIAAASTTNQQFNRTTTVWLLYGCLWAFHIFIYLYFSRCICVHFPLFHRELCFYWLRRCRRCRHLLLLLLKIKCECLYLVGANCMLYVHWMDGTSYVFAVTFSSSFAVLLIKMDLVCCWLKRNVKVVFLYYYLCSCCCCCCFCCCISCCCFLFLLLLLSSWNVAVFSVLSENVSRVFILVFDAIFPCQAAVVYLSVWSTVARYILQPKYVNP